MKEIDNYVFFYGKNDHFSNFYKTTFKVNDITFSCGEQYIMYSKAKLFGDDIIAEKILEETSPSKMKALGRKVKNYDDKVWVQMREDITFNGLLHKYMQNLKLKTQILNTNNKILVEASPTDKIWGIGMGVSNPDLENQSKWGKNILGNILMSVRENIK